MSAAAGAATDRIECAYSAGLKKAAHWIAVTTLAAAVLTRRTRFMMTLLWHKRWSSNLGCEYRPLADARYQKC
jgi:hypothetical protein